MVVVMQERKEQEATQALRLGDKDNSGVDRDARDGKRRSFWERTCVWFRIHCL